MRLVSDSEFVFAKQWWCEFASGYTDFQSSWSRSFFMCSAAVHLTVLVNEWCIMHSMLLGACHCYRKLRLWIVLSETCNNLLVPMEGLFLPLSTFTQVTCFLHPLIWVRMHLPNWRKHYVKYLFHHRLHDLSAIRVGIMPKSTTRFPTLCAGSDAL